MFYVFFYLLFFFCSPFPSLLEVWLVVVVEVVEVVGGALGNSSIHFSFVGRNVFLSKAP